MDLTNKKASRPCPERFILSSVKIRRSFHSSTGTQYVIAISCVATRFVCLLRTFFSHLFRFPLARPFRAAHWDGTIAVLPCGDASHALTCHLWLACRSTSCTHDRFVFIIPVISALSVVESLCRKCLFATGGGNFLSLDALFPPFSRLERARGGTCRLEGLLL